MFGGGLTVIGWLLLVTTREGCIDKVVLMLGTSTVLVLMGRWSHQTERPRSPGPRLSARHRSVTCLFRHFPTTCSFDGLSEEPGTGQII
jgi:hypothetical protein